MILGVEEERLKVKGAKCKGPSIKAVAPEIPGKISRGSGSHFRAMCSINRYLLSIY